MFARKSERPFLSARRWFVVPVILSATAVACAQFGAGQGVGKPVAGQPPEHRLFPNGLPPIETMLKAALEHHPDVVAARSKLRVAEAEQRLAEIKALKEVMTVRERWEAAEENRKVLPGELQRNSLANLAAIEWELSFLLGTRGEPATRGAAGTSTRGDPATQGVTAAPVLPAAVESAIPRGERAAMIKSKASQKIKLNAGDPPLTEFFESLGKLSGLRFLLDRQALEEEGYALDANFDNPQLDEVELSAALQILEDSHKSLYFVVRDYGILVTTESRRSSRMVSVLDFWKLTEDELRDTLRQQRQEELSQPTGGGMGGGGGGFF